MSASAGSTTVMRMPCALTWLEATAAPVSQATLAMGQSAKVSTTILAVIYCDTRIQVPSPSYVESSIQNNWSEINDILLENVVFKGDR